MIIVFKNGSNKSPWLKPCKVAMYIEYCYKFYKHIILDLETRHQKFLLKFTDSDNGKIVNLKVRIIGE